MAAIPEIGRLSYMDRNSPIAHNTRHMDNLNRQLKRLVDSGLSDRYIADHLFIDIERVERAHCGEFDPPPPKLQAVKRAAKLVPASRQFPELPDQMTDARRIVVLARHGLSAEKIRKHLKKPLSTRKIWSIATKHLGRRSLASNSAENSLGNITVYVHEVLREFGKDRYTCEICLEAVPQGCVIHHTKYEGATVYDLLYICQSCNLSRENKGLS